MRRMKRTKCRNPNVVYRVDVSDVDIAENVIVFAIHQVATVVLMAMIQMTQIMNLTMGIV
jgi:hypothetical protein